MPQSLEVSCLADRTDAPAGSAAPPADCESAGDPAPQAVSGSCRRWLITALTPSSRMLTPYSASATSIVRF